MTDDNGLEGGGQSFAQGLETIINRYSQENASDTPDFILADYMQSCLAAYNEAVRRRDRWYDFHPWGAHRRVDEAPVNIDTEAR